jgi:hypothetical protein
VRHEFTCDGLKILELAGLEGLSDHQIKPFNQLVNDENRYRVWLETHYQTCTHPGVVAMSEHMLIVCRKLR